MKCDNAIETFLKLDNGQSLPLLLRVHLFKCPACKEFINTFQGSLSQLRTDSYSQSKVDFSDAIMNKVQTLNQPEPHIVGVSNFKWILAGCFIIAGFVCIPFSNYSQTLINYFGTNLELPLYVVMGCAITVYSAIFVMSHASIFNYKVIERFLQK